jgi:Bacterial low temperature requirement A protein (LtrA)
LFFVVVIFQLAHNLEEDFSLNGFLGFSALFVPVWWSWIGSSFYATRFDTDDLVHRILVLLQMVGAAFLAVYVSDALGNGSVGFALSYAAIRIILVLEYVQQVLPAFGCFVDIELEKISWSWKWSSIKFNPCLMVKVIAVAACVVISQLHKNK